MSIKQTSKIMVRSGLQNNLPLLSKGEFGWCVDTQQLYIGNGSIEDGAPFIGNTNITGSGGGGSNYIPISGIPTGTKNSINTIFALPNVPIANTLIVWVNSPQILNIDYTVSGTTIIFTIPPASTDNLFFQCWIPS